MRASLTPTLFPHSLVDSFTHTPLPWSWRRFPVSATHCHLCTLPCRRGHWFVSSWGRCACRRLLICSQTGHTAHTAHTAHSMAKGQVGRPPSIYVSICRSPGVGLQQTSEDLEMLVESRSLGCSGVVAGSAKVAGLGRSESEASLVWSCFFVCRRS